MYAVMQLGRGDLLAEYNELSEAQAALARLVELDSAAADEVGIFELDTEGRPTPLIRGAELAA